MRNLCGIRAVVFVLSNYHSSGLILAVIQSLKVMEIHSGIPFYQDAGTVEVVDLNMVQCLVGRVEDRGKYAIIDRTNGHVQTTIT